MSFIRSTLIVALAATIALPASAGGFGDVTLPNLTYPEPETGAPEIPSQGAKLPILPVTPK